ncbi:hypothetical protein HK105_203849 [Polyrhizophydium stewartii]|uniref:Protein kinase domain-containing protein n=1 Tax=Polyrhizophydium stewartii TaxID=2732419 RepID=A0ABR4NB42_9FUNG|nr:hypothetical protein HK105_005966 [Polyrhizophydium stewartii]
MTVETEPSNVAADVARAIDAAAHFVPVPLVSQPLATIESLLETSKQVKQGGEELEELVALLSELKRVLAPVNQGRFSRDVEFKVRELNVLLDQLDSALRAGIKGGIRLFAPASERPERIIGGFNDKLIALKEILKYAIRADQILNLFALAKTHNLVDAKVVEIAAPVEPAPQPAPSLFGSVYNRIVSIIQTKPWALKSTDVEILRYRRIDDKGAGAVFVGRFKDEEVAVKVITVPLDDKAIRSIERHADMWFSLDHPGLIKIKGVALEADQPIIVSKLLKTNLAAHLAENNKTSLAARIAYLIDIAKALKYLHSQPTPVVHGDLSTSNVLVDANGSVVLNFNSALARSISRPFPGAEEKWAAPEQLLEKFTVSPLADVFSFGLVAFEVISGSKAFHDHAADHIRQGDRPIRAANVPDALWQIMRDCWEVNPEARPTLDEVIRRLSVL